MLGSGRRLLSLDARYTYVLSEALWTALCPNSIRQAVVTSAWTTTSTCPLLSNVRAQHTDAVGGGEELAAAVASTASHEPVTEAKGDDDSLDLTPKTVVDMLNRNIVGQQDAKRAVAIALRNRWRRHKVPPPLSDEIMPKNILMIGPTGCGKTEIARRLAKLADAPFVKVEATKFTEVGFHGRDVDQIIRDLVDNAIMMMRNKLRQKFKKEVEENVEKQLVDVICGKEATQATIEAFTKLLAQGGLEDRMVKVTVPESRRSMLDGPMFGGVGLFNSDIVVKIAESSMSRRSRNDKDKREMKVSEARKMLTDAEYDRVISEEAVVREAVAACESDGIVFIDEIDKIVTSSANRYGADASAEGVQRDLLPIIEGSVVTTKHGNVNTDHILFIASGAFHSVKPADMLAELQGRLPIRVELKGLTQDDLYRILTEPEANMIKQQQALLETEGVKLEFSDEAIREIARVAEEVNRSVDNIGARRLHTVLERIVDEVSFTAPELASQARQREEECKYVVTPEMVRKRVGDLLKKRDVSQYIL